MEQRVQNYPGTTVALYLVADMLCENCLTNIDKFSKVKKKYTKDFIKGIQQKILAAEAMPDQEMRQGLLTAKRIDVTSANTIVCTDFQLIMGYIEDGFEENRIPVMKKLAGNGYYTDANNDNWQSASTLVSRSLDFIADNAADLQEGGMPDGFADDYTKRTGDFTDKLKTFYDYKTTVEEETTAKQTANNSLYKSLKGIMRDGKRIFKEDATLKKAFTYNALLKKVRKGGKTGFNITLLGEATAPITKAAITFMPGGKVFSDIEKDKIKAELVAGDYEFTLTVPGYTEVTGKLTANAGVMHRKQFILKKAASSAAIA